MKKRMFTLIELLVVIAIIAILASMLLPALNQARERGKSANCQGTLKQHGVATQQYLQDFDYFPSLNNNKGVPDRLTWKFAMAPYLGITLDPAITNGKLQAALGKGAFRCPSWINGNNPLAATQYLLSDNTSAYRGGYGYNMPSLNGLGYTSASGSVSWIKPNRVKIPTETICTIDAACPLAQNDDTYRSVNSIAYVSSSPNDRAGIRHLGGLNIHWVDGHVSLISEGTLIQGKTSTKGSGASKSYYFFVADK